VSQPGGPLALAQSRAELNTIVLTQQGRDPVDEHSHLARQVTVLRVHDIERRGLREPVAEDQLEATTLHRLFQNKGGDLRDPETRFGRRHIAILVL